MLFKQPHSGDGHAPVNGLAHVIDGQQADLHGCQRLHLHACWAHRFDGGGATNRWSLWQYRELDGDSCQRQRVAKRYQVTGFLGSLDGGNPGNAQYISLFSRTALNQCKRFGLHVNATRCHGNTVCGGLGRNVNHMGLALRVKMRK